MAPDPTNILIISNCQVQPLKHGLASVCENVEIDAVPVHVITPEDREQVFSYHLADKEKYAVVLSIALSEDFGVFSSDKIVENFAPTPVLTISNLTYVGVHPDITYIGGLNARTPGPIGAYHSRIALLGYLMGLPEVKTAKLYCDAVYSHFGYYNAFEDSLNEMRRRDEATTIPIGDLLETCLREGLCFFSHNHPTSFLLAPYINKIAKALAERNLVSITSHEIRPEEMINFLAYSSIFPVYPEVAAHHGLSYEGSYVFRTETVGDVPTQALNLAAFIAGEYEAFADADQAFLLNSYPGNELMNLYGSKPDFQEMLSQL